MTDETPPATIMPLAEDADCCFWTPIIWPRSRRTSTMFHSTSCGRSEAATFKDKDWMFCPYCGKTLRIADRAQ
jgi:hypothetical protein